MKRLDYWTTRELLGRLLDEHGRDYRYTPGTPAGRVNALAHYRDGDEPGCGVGWVLTYAGWTLDELAAVEDTTPNAVDVAPDDVTRRAYCLWWDRTTPAARELLHQVQRFQDAGFDWGSAVDMAVRAVPSPGIVEVADRLGVELARLEVPA